MVSHSTRQEHWLRPHLQGHEEMPLLLEVLVDRKRLDHERERRLHLEVEALLRLRRREEDGVRLERRQQACG